jgi:hypothetical protein
MTSLLRRFWSRLSIEWSLQRKGRRCLKEFKFRKYRLPILQEKLARARLLRRLAGQVGTTLIAMLAAC